MATNSSSSGSSAKKRNSKSRSKKKKRLNELKRKATFIGIDLAWSPRNRTGCAIIQNERLVAYSGVLGTNQEIVAFIRSHLEDECPAVIGIDAPLRVPNKSGSRPCDKALSADWRRFEAGALPANRSLFARMNPIPHPEPANDEARKNVLSNEDDRDKGSGKGRGKGHSKGDRKGRGKDRDSQDNDGGKSLHNPVRGEVLVALLTERLRFSESALIPRRTNDRLVCEIYPHPAHVSLFGLEKTLKYKSRSGRKNEDRWPEFERYQEHLRSLRHAKPQLKRTKALLTQTDVRQFRGKALKEYEDTLDAITCAYVVYYLWTHGPDRARTYGTLADGHIIVPITEEVSTRL